MVVKVQTLKKKKENLLVLPGLSLSTVGFCLVHKQAFSMSYIKMHPDVHNESGSVNVYMSYYTVKVTQLKLLLYPCL